jgi:hypothetical protein
LIFGFNDFGFKIIANRNHQLKDVLSLLWEPSRLRAFVVQLKRRAKRVKRLQQFESLPNFKSYLIR